MLIANVTCIGTPGDSCGSVNGTLLYNASTNLPDNKTLGFNLKSKPFYSIEPNPQACGAMTVSNTCILNWTINTTGDETWKLGTNFTSDNSEILSNVTNYTIINIIGSTFSITISDSLSNVQFGTDLDPGSVNISALGNSPSTYNITCNNDAGNCNISITPGGDFVNASNYIRIENVTWSTPSYAQVRLNTSVGIINSSLTNLGVQRIFFWVGIPGGQPSGTYTSNFTVRGRDS